MRKTSFVVAAFAVSACAHASKGSAASDAAPKEAPRASMTQTLGAGYLPAGGMPDATLFTPPPPAAGSAAEARDFDASKDGLALKESARWRHAAVDADLVKGGGAGSYSCAAGVAIGETSTPALFRLMRRTAADFGQSTASVKARYHRPRPFTVNGQPTCTPEDEARLRGNGSYPSGHSAIGFGWGLALAEIFPDRAAALVARGREFGDSRRVCNAHWLSDVEEGRVAAAAIFARLQSDAGFKADLDAARREAASAAPAGNCP